MSNNQCKLWLIVLVLFFFQNHESESSDSEQENANPYLELVNSLGINSGLYTDQLKEKWNKDESEGDEDDEEMEQVESEKEVAEVRKHINGNIAPIRPEKFQVCIQRFIWARDSSRQE